MPLCKCLVALARCARGLPLEWSLWVEAAKGVVVGLCDGAIVWGGAAAAGPRTRRGRCCFALLVGSWRHVAVSQLRLRRLAAIPSGSKWATARRSL
eukprot:7783235-Alexandrium_andersonii.AAC.1